MSLESVLNNLVSVRNEFIQALSDKGVSVPENITINDCIELVKNLETSGTQIDLSDATATAADIAEGKTAYIASGKTSGTRPSDSNIVLGMIDFQKKFQPLSFSGTTPTNSGNPETVINYNSWNITSITPPQDQIEYLTSGYTGNLQTRMVFEDGLDSGWILLSKHQSYYATYWENKGPWCLCGNGCCGDIAIGFSGGNGFWLGCEGDGTDDCGWIYSDTIHPPLNINLIGFDGIVYERSSHWINPSQIVSIEFRKV